MPTLSHTRIQASGAEPSKWLYLLHGIYGSGRNWAGIARSLTQERPEWGVMLVDLRLHGGSIGFAPPHTVQSCAEDVRQLEQALGVPASALLGHSFGGKVALLRSVLETDKLEQVWVADTTLRARPIGGSVWEVLQIVKSLPVEFSSRDEVVAEFEKRGQERALGQWLAMNLERDGDVFRWKLDWEGVEQMLLDFFATDVSAILENPPAGVALQIIRATQSSAVDEEMVALLRKAESETGLVHLYEIDAGHWINVDKPEAVVRLLVEKLP
jgi:pimeloyl-ACP methyl ester carboxylesterase